MKEQKFNFFIPFEIKKAKDANGKTKMMLAGIASTKDVDSDNEMLLPEGFDLSYFKKAGYVNWHHQGKNNPEAIIGEPSKAEIRKEGLYVECDLYDTPMAEKVYELAKTLEKSSTTRRLGFSIEGKALERDSDNDKIVKKARITGLAITHMPKNHKTLAKILKGEIDDEEVEFDDVDETIDNKKVHISKDGDFVIQDNNLSKAEVFERIFSDCSDIDMESAKKIYNLIEKISQMATKSEKKPAITNEDINKAYDVLGLNKATETEEISETENTESEFLFKSFQDEDGNRFYRRIEKSEDGDENFADDEMYEKVGDGEFASLGLVKGDNDEVGEDENEESSEEDENVEVEETEENEEESEKAHSKNDIEKALKSFERKQDKSITALGTLLKGALQEINDLKGVIDDLGNAPQGRKSLSKGVERFGADDLEKGGRKNTNQLHAKTNRGQILNIMDSLAFEKGQMDEELANDLTLFESSGIVSDRAKAKLRAINIEVVG